MFTVSIDYLENNAVLTCDIVFDDKDSALACAGQYVLQDIYQAIFVTDPLGETLYCVER